MKRKRLSQAYLFCLYSSLVGLSAGILSACNPSAGPNDGPSKTATELNQVSRVASSDTPNILNILADDLGTDKVGAYAEGDDATRPSTPNIDALADSGILFKNAYSYSECSPTRASILLGREAFRTGIGEPVAPNSGYTFQDYPSELPLPKLFSLANSGYTTAHFGKWHLALNNSDHDTHPLLAGFDHSSGVYENLDDYYSFTKYVDGTAETVNGYETRDIRNDVENFVDSTTEPWLAWVAFHAPHTPYHTPPSKMYSTAITDSSDKTQLYTATVEAMDTAIGQIVAHLPDNTVVFFLGDNGTPGPVTQEPFDSDKVKGTLYEGGINIPFIVSGSAVADDQKGKTSTALVHVMDIYATAAELAGIDVDSYVPDGLTMDSVSFVDELSDAAASGARNTVSAEMFSPNGLSDYTEHERMMRNRNYKLIQDVINGSEEFYKVSDAADGLDGTDLCPCPDNLSGNALTAYNRLHNQAEAMTND